MLLRWVAAQLVAASAVFEVAVGRVRVAGEGAADGVHSEQRTGEERRMGGRARRRESRALRRTSQRIGEITDIMPQSKTR
jgi:hypothetical protein